MKKKSGIKEINKSNKAKIAKVNIPLPLEMIEYLKKGKKSKIFLNIPLFQFYKDALDQLKSMYGSKSFSEKSSSFIPFVVTCAAALESLLNDYLITYSSYMYGLDNYNRFAEALLSIRLRGKLDIIIPLITDNKFIIKEDTNIYQKLIKLIRIRNELVHGKSLFNEYDLSVECYGKDGIKFSPIKLQKGKKTTFNTTLNDCRDFLSAIEEFESILSTKNIWQKDQLIKEENNKLLAKLPERKYHF